VPIGITAANKQAPLLMHLDYKVTLPDHDWVVAGDHKLIPSVYAGINIKPAEIESRSAVTYSGPTYIAVHSGKHSSSTALSHVADFSRLLKLPEFDAVTKTTAGHVKPVLMVTVDSGPDENPRYDKVICVAIHHFLENDLDVFIVATNASTSNQTNLKSSRMTPEQFPCSGEQERQESKYCTQIVKCEDSGCCRPHRSSAFSLLPSGFLPPPIPLLQTSEGLKAPDPGNQIGSKFTSLFLALAVKSDVLPRSLTGYHSMSYDAYCPSVQSVLMRRTCKKCGLYHTSLSALKGHTRVCDVSGKIQCYRYLSLNMQ